jgi:hypothetical protein
VPCRQNQSGRDQRRGAAPALRLLPDAGVSARLNQGRRNLVGHTAQEGRGRAGYIIHTRRTAGEAPEENAQTDRQTDRRANHANPFCVCWIVFILDHLAVEIKGAAAAGRGCDAQRLSKSTDEIA